MKLQKVTGRLGFEPEWIETQNAMKSVRSLEKRIHDGHVTAVVIPEGLMGHKHFEPIIAAAGQTGTPLAYGDTAGTGALRKAFAKIEGMQGNSGDPARSGLPGHGDPHRPTGLRSDG